MDVEATQFDGHPYESMRAARGADALVGMHGAGMVHSMFLSPVRSGVPPVSDVCSLIVCMGSGRLHRCRQSEPWQTCTRPGPSLLCPEAQSQPAIVSLTQTLVLGKKGNFSNNN